MMQITILGSTGPVGKAVVKEALKTGELRFPIFRRAMN